MSKRTHASLSESDSEAPPPVLKRRRSRRRVTAADITSAEYTMSTGSTQFCIVLASPEGVQVFVVPAVQLKQKMIALLCDERLRGPMSLSRTSSVLAFGTVESFLKKHLEHGVNRSVRRALMEFLRDFDVGKPVVTGGCTVIPLYADHAAFVSNPEDFAVAAMRPRREPSPRPVRRSESPEDGEIQLAQDPFREFV